MTFRRVLVPLGLVLGSTFLTLLLVERAMEFLDLEYSPLEIQNKNKTGDEIRIQHAFEDEHFIADPELIWRPRPGVDVFNEQGFRGPVLTRKRPGEFRVFTIGDSNTLGWSGADGTHWPGNLRRLLAAEVQDSVVVNAGVWGYSAFQGKGRLAEVLPHEPDVVLISFGANDGHEVRVPDREYVVERHRPGRARRWTATTRLGRWILGTLDGFGAGDAPLRPRVGLPEYRELLREMIAETRAAGASPVLLTRPYIGGLLRQGTWKVRAHEYNLATAEVASERDVPLVDFYTLFKTRDSLFEDESHFTAEGHERAAGLAFRQLRALWQRE